MSWDGPSFTPVAITPGEQRIRYGDKIMLLGSCFTEHIANKLQQLKYTVHQNPFGILYNPVAMANAIRRIVNHQLYTASELVHHDDLYHSMDHHGTYSGPNEADVLNCINTSLEEAYNALAQARFVFISPGTAIVYQYVSTGQISGNCHKISQAAFSKSMLSVADCLHAFEQMLNDIRNISPTAKLIWTVSPVRHISEGLIQNQRSKATLITAISEICQQHPTADYFPAYEIMVDQLRDYRYYERDMIHPSAEAIDIIWDAFKTTYIDERDVAWHGKIEKINRAIAHRFLQDQAAARTKFASSQIQAIADLEKQFPSLSWENEKAYFQSIST